MVGQVFLCIWESQMAFFVDFVSGLFVTFLHVNTNSAIESEAKTHGLGRSSLPNNPTVLQIVQEKETLFPVEI